MDLKLPSDVAYILERLNGCGYEAYVVGGCVRDSIIGLSPHDWDICTSALPDEVVEIFNDNKIIPTGLKHGTVTVVINDCPYEITTYRIDGEYKDNRHPSNVTYTSKLEDDLRRRDFTINAMAYNPNDGVVDLFGGISDIEAHIIRCVGNPDYRFSEDALRLMRAVRFASVLNYDIEENTLKSIIKNKALLKNIAMERINAELTKTLSVCENTMIYELLDVIVPQISNGIAKIKGTTIYSLSLCGKMSLLCEFSKTKIQEVMRKLRFDNQTIKCAIDIAECVSSIYFGKWGYNSIFCDRMILHQNDSIFCDVINCLYKAERIYGKSVRFYNGYIESLLKDYVKAQSGYYRLSHLKINGDDLLRFGFQGKEIGEILNAILIAVMKDEIRNEKCIELEYAKSFKNIPE